MTAAARQRHPDDLWVGTTVGGYAIAARIASSGHATVYRARKGGAELALKVSRAIKDPSAPARLGREVTALSRVAHPAVASLIEAGALPDGSPFVATPWIDGELLEAVLARGPSWSELAPILSAIADGLAALHGAGIVHRDLKPTNVMVPAAGRPAAVILDLGHASLLGEVRITQTGRVVGSVGYMAPEQLRGELDARTDLYAVGILLYRAVTGELPVSAMAMLRGESVEIRLPKRRPSAVGYPAGVEDLCMWLLARDPQGRLPSARVLAVTVAALSGR